MLSEFLKFFFFVELVFVGSERLIVVWVGLIICLFVFIVGWINLVVVIFFKDVKVFESFIWKGSFFCRWETMIMW